MDAKKYIAEFIGTFFLVLTIGCTVKAGGGLPPLAIGAVLMVMIYANGHISGAHFNPAVTVAIWLRGRCPVGDVAPYMVAQVLGASAGAFTVGFLLGAPTDGGFIGSLPRDLGLDLRRIVAEFLFTFALAYVVLNVATAKATAGNNYYGLAIGFTVMAGAFAVGGISGGAFNPAVAVGISIMGLAQWSNLWIYLVGCFGGATAAALTFKALNPNDK